jgi:putative ABC transport system substrate-binding protein
VDPVIRSIQSLIADLQAAARTLGLRLVVASAGNDSELEMAFTTLSLQRVGAVLVGISSFYNQRTEQLAALAAHHALPAIFQYREHALAGGLMSYGSSFGHLYHQAGIYTGRILRGEKPADLPVLQPTKFEFVINLKTAKALARTKESGSTSALFMTCCLRGSASLWTMSSAGFHRSVSLRRPSSEKWESARR